MQPNTVSVTKVMLIKTAGCTSLSDQSFISSLDTFPWEISTAFSIFAWMKTIDTVKQVTACLKI